RRVSNEQQWSGLGVERIASPRVDLGGCWVWKETRPKKNRLENALIPLPPTRPVSEFRENPGDSETVPPGRAVTEPYTGRQNFIL
ncbi:hypothetical protein, partial [Pseudomonas aeruginosa]|uniref:hypothetical protein n=1 Tax=Pseudomonas aeruginosa TaxID=287 RepID=UPI00287E4E84